MISDSEIKLIRDLRKKNKTINQIIQITQLSEPTVRKYINTNVQVRRHKRKRSKYELCAEVLELLLDGPLRLTWVFNGANLSHSLTVKYLDILVYNKMVYEDNDFFYINDTGRAWLRKFLAIRLKDLFSL